ncbi:TraB/GumN family protein [Phenylobacterium sp.]|uniref:TraB/GumN family protein n=1 Tax=Phenylobacterium sp. TaxID=1871053 RepID=UPI002B65F8BB|nr:TraB/GumN family protein [Phenylobacterium sp.]HLZ75346.1 TraB/GumN family protein [Phenylobacterium sp.]
MRLSAVPQYRTIPGPRAGWRRRTAALGLALALATPAMAQVPLAASKPDPNDPDSVLVEELVVVGRLPGPAWWTVSNGTTTVYVLGSPSLAPKHMTWDRAIFERHLAGASVVILPFQDVHVTVLGSFGAAFNYLRLKGGGPFEATLDPATKARFVAVRTRLGESADHYGTKNPLAAGLVLATDYRQKTGLTTSDPTKLIKLLAARARVPVSQKAYDLGPVMGAVIRTPPAAGRACFDEVLAQAEAGPGITQGAAAAWAKGDVPGALANERTYERCIALVPGAQAFDARTKADQVAQIEQALKKPGHAVAVVPLRPLLAQGGVLDQLRAKGFTVTTPGEES